MAAADEKGTGQHKHKSTEEPYPHHEAPTTSGQGSHTSHSSSHSSSHDTRGDDRSRNDRSRDDRSRDDRSRDEHGSSRHDSSSHSSSGRSEDADLRSREYTGADGQEHHHTKTYMEQHKGETGSEKGGKKSAA